MVVFRICWRKVSAERAGGIAVRSEALRRIRFRGGGSEYGLVRTARDL